MPPRGARQDPQRHPASSHPGLPDTARAHGTRRCGLLHPSQPWQSPLPAVPSPSSVARRRRAGRPRHRTAHPPASAPSVATLTPPHARQPPPLSFPAAIAAPLSCPCMLVRIEPLPAIRAPKVPDPNPGGNFSDTGGCSKAPAGFPPCCGLRKRRGRNDTGSLSPAGDGGRTVAGSGNRAGKAARLLYPRGLLRVAWGYATGS